MRVVLDTVVLIRGPINPLSWCGRLVFDEITKYRWVVSPELVAEYLDVISRPELVRRYRTVATRDVATVFDQLATATLVDPTDTPAVCRNPSDDKFLAAAKEGGVKFIVSEDLDLLELNSYEGIQNVNAETFLRVLDQSASLQA